MVTLFKHDINMKTCSSLQKRNQKKILNAYTTPRHAIFFPSSFNYAKYRFIYIVIKVGYARVQRMFDKIISNRKGKA